MKHIVVIEESVSKEFVIECDENEDPVEIARIKYKAGEYVLEPGDVTAVQAMVKYSDGSQSEWMEF